MGNPDASNMTEGDERQAADMIASNMETMRMTIEDLEDAVVLMRQALAPHPSHHVSIFDDVRNTIAKGEPELSGKSKPKKDKKLKRSKLSSMYFCRFVWCFIF
ncbi:hypothetical protein QFC19_001872 [Naganishia cerealis]|uniref:Uncharacterized protein n=1 Tax=Naganishia cerealis TaxID=610337 RepID=A0ACC2WH69_9TREE|nr:hypothetical protein QFC19_001872 [Naganishia cerealis]